MDDEVRTAARAAYRLGILDVALDEEVLDVLNVSPKGVIAASLTGERQYRLEALEHVGITRDDLRDLEIGKHT